MDENRTPYAIPVSLDRRQRRFVAGVRYALDFLNICIDRLREGALQINDPSKGLLDNTSPRSLRTSMFCDAWTAVDNLNRLRRLLHFLEEYEGPAGQVFLSATESVKNLRAVMQHPDWDYKKPDELISASNVLGSLLWVDYRGFENYKPHTFGQVNRIDAGPNVNSSRVRERSIEVVREPLFNIGEITLFAYDFSLNLDRARKLANDAASELSFLIEQGWSNLIVERAKSHKPLSEQDQSRLSPDWADGQLIRVKFEP